MWVALIKLTSFLGRVAAFSFSVVALALISLTLSQRDWMDGISIYIVVVGCISILAALIPPYPNFLIDGLFAAAWIIAAAFSFLVMVCYISLPIHLSGASTNALS
jgi:flagellar biosynthesis component FlhA